MTVVFNLLRMPDESSARATLASSLKSFIGVAVILERNHMLALLSNAQASPRILSNGTGSGLRKVLVFVLLNQCICKHLYKFGKFYKNVGSSSGTTSAIVSPRDVNFFKKK